MRRYVVHLTEAQRDAVLEALAFRLAGPLDPGLSVRGYNSAEDAVRLATLKTVERRYG